MTVYIGQARTYLKLPVNRAMPQSSSNSSLEYLGASCGSLRYGRNSDTNVESLRLTEKQALLCQSWNTLSEYVSTPETFISIGICFFFVVCNTCVTNV